MKRTLLASLFLVLSPVASQAAVLDFNAGVPSGVSLGGGMRFNSTGGGHIYMETWDNNDYLYFSSPTTVNSFQMNREPWQGYTASPDDWLVTIEAFDNSSASLWQTTLDLENYDAWSEWLTVDVDTANVSSMTFYATGSWTPMNYGFWPSIDNMMINEPLGGGNVPEPGSLVLLGLGLAGLGLSRRRKV